METIIKSRLFGWWTRCLEFQFVDS